MTKLSVLAALVGLLLLPITPVCAHRHEEDDGSGEDYEDNRPRHVKIPLTSWSNQDEFDRYWHIDYPWANDYNGGARMDGEHVRIRHNSLLLTAEPVTGQPPVTYGKAKPITIPINYLSGAVYSRNVFNVTCGGGYDISGHFKVNTTKGVWPSVWLTGKESWPPQIDIAEWRGDGHVHYNTFNTSSEVTRTDLAWPDQEEYHHVRTVIRDINGRDVSVEFYLNGELQATQFGANYINKPMYLIISLQMEGASGEPGPQEKVTMGVKKFSAMSFNPRVERHHYNHHYYARRSESAPWCQRHTNDGW